MRKIFVLDTNVLMHDPTCIFRFEEHDVFIPLMTLDELDNHKKGKEEINRNVRQVLRAIKELADVKGCKITEGIDLTGPSEGLATGRLFLQSKNMEGALPTSLPMTKVDHQILSVITHMQDSEVYKGCMIILVTKDINMYIKAKALGYMVEDYLNDKVIEDSDLLYSGALELPDDFWSNHSDGMVAKKDRQSGISTYRVTGPLCSTFYVNQLLWSESLDLECIVREVSGDHAVLQTLVNYRNQKHSVFGIHPRNREQNFACNLLLDPDIDFVSLLGQAGTGKTLLAIAAGLHQTIDGNRFGDIIMTRVTVSVGEDIGFLPGTEEEKMGAWMGALEDNLEVLVSVDGNHSKDDGAYGINHIPSDIARKETHQLIRNRIKVKSLNFMRGRTFFRRYLIIDEAQNLTPKQMKTLITRAGPGTKVICLGNIGQIDSPYLTEGSSGLTYVVDRFKGQKHVGHIILQRGERSRLADLANESL
ncbi:PhoH family protein [Candidatus Kaiserbacteria bacterium]|nr:MAG: PhoH family protein [Candidatus Kaiserbacteria bacterium]